MCYVLSQTCGVIQLKMSYLKLRKGEIEKKQYNKYSHRTIHV